MARFQSIDELLLPEHFHLNSADKCYFVLEYTSGKNYSYSKTNSLISNLKKKPSTKNTAQWHHKLNAISTCSQGLAGLLNHDWLRAATLIPVPPSKAKDHQEYDPRMLNICQRIPVDFPIDVRELVIQTESHDAAHEGGHRPSPEELIDIYEINEEVADPVPTTIGIVDDILTAGSHYRAMHSVLSERFPNVEIAGFFIARRVFPTDQAAADFDAV